MRFHSLIYRELERHSLPAAASFLQDFKSFKGRRSSFMISDYELVVAYFSYVFSHGNYPHELRCITGNRHSQYLWLEDFRNVILPSFIRDYKQITIHSKKHSDTLISELGSLLGIS